MAINQKRTANMKKKSMSELLQIAKSGSLSAVAAQYEIDRRNSK